MLNAKILNKYKNGFCINVKFNVEPNSYNILLGPSGSGKSLTLKVLSGFEKIMHGYIKLNGNDITYLPPEKRNIVYLPQNLGLFPHMKVREQIYYPYKARKIPVDGSFISHIIKEFKIEHLMDRFPNQLSGGESQRVALARCIVTRPEVLLLDEPLTGLDFHLKMKLMDFLKTIKRIFSLTVIHVTHDPIEAFYLGERLFIIENGKLEFSGSSNDFWNSSGNGFINSIKIQLNELGKIISF